MSLYDHRTDRVRPSTLEIGSELYYDRGRHTSKPMPAKVTKLAKTTVTIEVPTPSGIVWTRVFGIDREADLVRTERKTKDNEFPERYSEIMTVETAEKLIARQDAQKRVQDAKGDIKRAWETVVYNSYSAESLDALKNVIGVLEDVRRETGIQY